jgi:diguanylate cyclase (GGDEF)-like protein
MFHKWRLEIVLASLVLLTALAILFEKNILQGTLEITPQDGYALEAYSDASNQGDSTARITDADNFRWECQVKSKFAYPYCGFELALGAERHKGKDLSKYSKIRLTLDYKGPGKTLRLYLRNFDPRYSKTSDKVSTKFNQLEFSTELLKNGMVEFEFDDFFVADWWITEYKLEPRLRRPQFNNITIIEIQTGARDSLGDHAFHLQKLELVGQTISTESWYRSIIFTWLTAILLFLAFRIVLLSRQVRKQATREAALLEINAFLDVHSKELEERSKTDALTGAFNREGVDEAMHDGISQWRSRKTPFSLILLDIDHFKEINDTHGHPVGDYVLLTLSHIVKAHIRTHDLLARWGGEEFVLVCRDTKLDQAVLIAEKIREIIETYAFDHGIHVTASFGVSTLKGHGVLDELFQSADKALYEAKNNGRNQVRAASV